MTRDEAVAAFKRLGQVRFGLVTCMTCMDRANVRYRAEVDGGVLAVLGREIQRVSYSRHTEERDRLLTELTAITALIEAHRDEFDAYLDGVAASSSLDDARRKKRA